MMYSRFILAMLMCQIPIAFIRVWEKVPPAHWVEVPYNIAVEPVCYWSIVDVTQATSRDGPPKPL